jgi:hypothetical protein
MDDLTTRIADLFWRFQADFRRLAHDELAHATEAFRREVDALIAERSGGRS